MAEIVDAPEHVQQLLEKVLTSVYERLLVTEEAEALRDAYIAARVVSPKWADDALHVAHASLAYADVIASWNFKHLINPVRVQGFNAVNAEFGYGAVVMMTPEDIVRDWKEDGYDSE